MVGSAVGWSVGLGLGCAVGTGLGWSVGSGLGWSVGSGLGWSVGSGLGCGEGSGEGCGVGCGVGSSVGWSVGLGTGCDVGAHVYWLGRLSQHGVPRFVLETKDQPVVTCELSAATPGGMTSQSSALSETEKCAVILLRLLSSAGRPP